MYCIIWKIEQNARMPDKFRSCSFFNWTDVWNWTNKPSEIFFQKKIFQSASQMNQISAYRNNEKGSSKLWIHCKKNWKTLSIARLTTNESSFTRQHFWRKHSIHIGFPITQEGMIYWIPNGAKLGHSAW